MNEFEARAMDEIVKYFQGQILIAETDDTLLKHLNEIPKYKKYKIDHIRRLIELIQTHQPMNHKIFKIEEMKDGSGFAIQSTGLINDFIDSGGFSAIYRKEIRRQEREYERKERREELELDSLESAAKVNRLKLENFPATERRAKWGLGISIASIILATIALYYKIFIKP